MIDLIKLLTGLIPVIIFLAVLIAFDSFKLVKYRIILQTVLFGALAALLSLYINQGILRQFDIPYLRYSRYGAPFIEETLKAVILVYYFRSAKIGFMVDAAIFGFAAGAGFAIVENIFRLQAETLNPLAWLVRGLGTAVMHGATTAIFAVISKYLIDRHMKLHSAIYLPGLGAAFLIHSFFNHLLIRPDYITMIQLVSLPLLFWVIYTRSEKSLHNWLELGIDSEFELLEFLTSGTISQTKMGEYLASLKTVIPGEKIVDMICYLRVYLELSICAKGLLLMQQHGYKLDLDEENRDKLEELKYLQQSIGKTGQRALAVIYRAEPKELWQIFLLKGR